MTELRRTLTELRRTLTELRRTITELRRTLLSYVAFFFSPLHQTYGTCFGPDSHCLVFFRLRVVK